MQEILTPALGSNQFITKFDERVKDKKAKRIKIKFGLKRKMIALATIILLSSLYLNYYFFKTNYVITCEIKVGEVVQDTAGHFMNKTRCDRANENWISAINYEIDLRTKAYDGE